MVVQTEEIRFLHASQLEQAYKGSYYTIAGCGGELESWVRGYEELLRNAGIRAPKRWFRTNGLAVNVFAMREGAFVRPDDMFQNELTLLMFPLDEIGAGGKLALFRLRMEDRWFDDIINNMRGKAI